MRVFTVAHILSFHVLNVVGVRKIARLVLRIAATKVIGNHAIISGGMFEGFYH